MSRTVGYPSDTPYGPLTEGHLFNPISPVVPCNVLSFVRGFDLSFSSSFFPPRPTFFYLQRACSPLFLCKHYPICASILAGRPQPACIALIIRAANCTDPSFPPYQHGLYERHGWHEWHGGRLPLARPCSSLRGPLPH